MYSRILIPMDGSEAAEIVLPYVEEIAARSGSEMILASVSETENAELERMYQPYLEELSSKVESELEVWRAKGGTTVQYDIIMGTPASEIVRYADENDVNLIAMASRGSSGQGPWLLGNIAAKVLRSTSKPVLLIRKPVSEVGLQQKNLIKRVLLPLDGSELGEGAIPQVEALAKALDVEVVLLHVLESVVTAAMPGLASVTIPSAKEEVNRMNGAIDYLNKIEGTLGEEGLSVSSEVVSGSAANQIIAYAEENSIDIIAMSTHGRSGIGRWVFGSVTDKVLHAGDIPVLTVRATRA